MDLHELMGTAVADLPDLPDQLTDVERIHRRRTATKRASLISVGTALVLGVGTLTIASPWAAKPASITAGDSPRAFPQQVIELLQPIWPRAGETITWDPGALETTGGGSLPIQRYEVFKVTTSSGSSYLLRFSFGASPQGVDTPDPNYTCPPGCTGSVHWEVNANLVTREQISGDEPSGNLVVQDGQNMLAVMAMFGRNELTAAELNKLGASTQMHALRWEAGADGLYYQDFSPSTGSPSPGNATATGT